MESAPEALAALDAALADAERRILAPPPPLTGSQWADRYRRLARESSAEPGEWRTDRAPYQREILDALTDPTIPEIVLMSASQVGKSEVLLNGIGIFAHGDPCPILLVEPTIGEAESFSRTRIAPMIRETPALRGIFGDPKSRDGGNTLTQKEFPGGHLTIVGANSPSGLAAKPIRAVFFDEVDRAPASAGAEGDPVSLARRRTETFWNRKIVTVSSPTITGVSRIEDAFLKGSQAHYHVPCPDCGTRQRLEWRRPDGSYGITFERDEAGEIVEASVGYVCGACGVVIPERRKLWMLQEGAWVHAHPERRIKSYQLSALYSPWATWAHVAREFVRAKDHPETLKTFVNTILGETWDDRGERIDPQSLSARAVLPPGAVPAEVGVLTAGVDVQGDRVEVLIVGWGHQERGFVLEWHQCWGDPAQDAVWQEATAIVQGVRDGLRVAAVCADTGYQPDRVWRWLDGLRVPAMGIKGMPGRGRLVLQKPAAKTKRGSRSPWMVGVDTAKDLLAARLPLADGPGAIHYAEDIDPVLFDHLTSEQLVTVYVQGRPTRAWRLIPGRRNEGLDLLIYALAALYSRGARTMAALGTLAERRAAPAEAPAAAEDAPPRRRVRVGGYDVGRWSW